MPSKKPHLQLYADECFPVSSVTHLKSLGYSITHAFDNKMVKKNDRLHLKMSKKLNRILITLDTDFSRYETMSVKDHPGIIVISVGSSTSPLINRVCEKFLKTLTEKFMKEAIVKITVNKIIKTKNNQQLKKSY